MSKISIALATYNGSKYIEEQLNSISSQTVLPEELVVSDDGSDDDTLEIVEEFARSSPFEIRILPTHERLGFADNFFHAAASCRNNIIAFSDQDDVWSNKKLEIGLAPFEDRKVLLSMHTLTKTDSSLNPIGLHRQGIHQSKTFSPLQINPFATGWGNSMMFSKSLLNVFPVSGRPKQPSGNRPLSHDTWIYTLAAALGAVAHIDTPLCFYRQHDLNTMGMGKSPFKEKISGALTASVGRYREIAIFFYAAMKTVFEDVAKHQDVVSSAAGDAKEHYKKLSDMSEGRLKVYTKESMASRAAAFLELHFHKEGFRHSTVENSRFSILKDALVGVLGIGYRDESRV